MAIQLNDNIYLRAGKPIDYKFGPYLSINEANENILIEERYNGLIFAVYVDPNDLQNSNIKYYYYTNQLSDLDVKELNYVDDQSIALSKLQDIGSMTIIGRVDASSGSPSEVDIITDLTGATSTTLATSQAIKTYVDNVLPSISNQENLDVDSAASEVVAQVSSTLYMGVFFDFVIKNGSNMRSGTVYAVHDGTNVEFTETSTADLGNTLGVTLSVDLSGGNIRLLATTTTDNWVIKSLVRGI